MHCCDRCDVALVHVYIIVVRLDNVRDSLIKFDVLIIGRGMLDIW